MRTLVVAAAATITAFVVMNPAMAKDSPSRSSPVGRGTSDQWPAMGTGAPSFGDTPCSQILGSPRSYPKGQVDYCRSVERGG